jgi:hypothetical protein
MRRTTGARVEREGCKGICEEKTVGAVESQQTMR